MQFMSFIENKHRIDNELCEIKHGPMSTKAKRKSR